MHYWMFWLGKVMELNCNDCSDVVLVCWVTSFCCRFGFKWKRQTRSCQCVRLVQQLAACGVSCLKRRNNVIWRNSSRTRWCFNAACHWLWNIDFIHGRVVKTTHSFWPVNRDQKDRLTATAYAAPTAIVPDAGLPGCPSLTAVGLIQWIRISDFGLLDPDGDPDSHQNLSSWWSLGHALPLQVILSKSVDNFSSYMADRQTDRSKNITLFFGRR